MAAASCVAPSTAIVVLASPALAQTTAPGSKSVTATISINAQVVTLVNVLTVEPANQPQLLASLRDNTENVITKLKGWFSTSLIASHDKRRVIIYSQWRTAADVEAMQADPSMVAYFPTVAALATFDATVGDVVFAHSA